MSKYYYARIDYTDNPAENEYHNVVITNFYKAESAHDAADYVLKAFAIENQDKLNVIDVMSVTIQESSEPIIFTECADLKKIIDSDIEIPNIELNYWDQV